ncbi:hypothetical protein IAT40_007918 [Kwoniella sp. CBS 6097]
MSLRSLRDTLSQVLTGSASSSADHANDFSSAASPMDAESVWAGAGDALWSDSHSHAASSSSTGGWLSWVPGFGLGFGHSHSSGYHHHGTDWRNLFFWFAIFAIMLLFAVATNPTESSFRAHLTEMSFRRHLADIRRSDTDDSSAPPLTDEQAQLPSSSTPIPITASAPETRRGSASGVETPTHTVAPFRFANHVAISLRTPTLLYRSLVICSVTITSPIAPPAYLSDPPPTPLSRGKHASPVIKERHVIWFGCMGHWSLIGFVPQSVEWAWKTLTRGEREKGRKKSSTLDKAGVIEMRAVQNKDELPTNAKASLGHSTKNMRRTDSSTNLLTDSPSSHAIPPPISTGPLSPSESRRPSLVNLIATPPTAISADSPEIANNPVITALKADLTAAQSVLSELQAQLTSHEQAVHDAHSHLQKNLDELRNRRKEDDAERQEVKTRTKSLEEQKRQAEAARREAEKRLKVVEGVRDGLEGKISAAESEIRELKGNMESSEKNVRVLQEEGAKYVVETQETIDSRKLELDAVEVEIGDIESRNDELLTLIKDAEERLKTIVEAGEAARKMGPEEEMMMMAAAYEVAAQEGYLHGGYNQPAVTGTSTSGNGNGVRGGGGGGGGVGVGGGTADSRQGQDQWASQAAAYMAEAGMPHLGYDYTARPAQSNTTGFGHLSKHPNPNSASSRDLAEMRRVTDVTGFEDFGPGAAAAKRTTTPPHHPPSDSESDIYGHDPGSPNGGISTSFSANLLPQSLFSSLEGDQTPLVGGDEDLPGTLDEPHSFDLDNNQPLSLPVTVSDEAGDDGDDDSGGSDSADEDIWRSPMTVEPRLKDHPPMKRHSGSGSGMYGRLLAPTSSSNSGNSGSSYPSSMSNPAVNVNNASSGTPTSPPNIPGLPALPGSRRWFSGTVSSDNIPSTFGGFMHPTTSNDSLTLSGTYESSPSPFAPTSSEKKALAANWAPFGKRWTGALGGGGGSGNARGAAEETSGWPLSADAHLKAASSSALPVGGGGGGAIGEGLEDKGEKKPFRFFSLRKPSSSTSAGPGTTPP